MSINQEVFAVDGRVCEHPRTPTLPGLEETAGKRKSFRDRQLNIITNIKSLQNSPEKRKNSRYSVYSKFSPQKQTLGSDDLRAKEPMSSLLPQNYEKEFESRSSRSSSSYSSGMSKKYFNEISILKTKIRKIIRNQDCFNDKLFKQENEPTELNKISGPKPNTPIEDAYNFSFCNSFNLKDKRQYARKFPREVFCKITKDCPSFLSRFYK